MEFGLLSWVINGRCLQVAFFSMGVCTMLMTAAPFCTGYEYEVCMAWVGILITNISEDSVDHLLYHGSV